MEPIIDCLIPLPLVPGGRLKNQIITLNNIGKIHWSILSKAKRQFKEMLKTWILDENQGEKFKSLKIEVTIIRHNKRKIDADNPIIAYKWTMDMLTELGWAEDDCRNTLILNPSKYDPERNETLMDLKVWGNK